MSVSHDASHASQEAARTFFPCPVCGNEAKRWRGQGRFCGESCRREWDRRVREAGKAQLGLRLDNPIARTSDPVTSHVAAQGVTESGSRATHCAAVLEVLLLAPHPLTYREIAARLPKLEAVEVMRRLNDLRHESPPRVVQLDKRECQVSGRPAMTWATSATKEQAA